jgi:hypothetical protein
MIDLDKLEELFKVNGQKYLTVTEVNHRWELSTAEINLQYEKWRQSSDKIIYDHFVEYLKVSNEDINQKNS